MATVANVAFTDTVELWRTKTNQAINIVNQVETGVHPYSNLAIQASQTANNVANSAGNIAFNLVTSNTELMTRITDSTNTIITTVFSDIYVASNASFNRSNAAILTSNTAMIIANNAYNTANSFVANSANIVANIILSNAQTQNTLNLAVSAYANAFFANVQLATAFNKGNAAHLQANTARDLANIVYGYANTINDTLNLAYAQANTGGLSGNLAFDVANAAFDQANTGDATGNAAFIFANTVNTTMFTLVSAAFGQANTGRSHANSGFAQANTSRDQANAAYVQANAAFFKANSSDANVTIQTDNSTDASFYPMLTRLTTGNAANAQVSTTKLYFNPSTGTLNSTIFNSLSDENAKEDLRPVENALELIERLHGVFFKYKENHQASAGVTAQNLANVMPCLVTQGENDALTVNYAGLSALFIEAIKELNREVKAIKAKLES